MKTILYAKISKELLYSQGKELGLEGEALKFFTFYNEVLIEVEVDPKTGYVSNERIFDKSEIKL